MNASSLLLIVKKIKPNNKTSLLVVGKEGLDTDSSPVSQCLDGLPKLAASHQAPLLSNETKSVHVESPMKSENNLGTEIFCKNKYKALRCISGPSAHAHQCFEVFERSPRKGNLANR